VTGPDKPTGPDDPAEETRWTGSNAAYGAVGYILAGLLVWGGVGLALDHWLGTNFLLLIGLLLGGAAGLYLVYVRYGKG
jgi:ATP synthase protein I